jgi:predicted dehydrogenase
MDVGFIGVGNIAGKHLENVHSAANARVAAVCDINEETAIEVAQTYEARAYTDYRSFYEKEKLDAVIVSIPPFAHEGQEIEAAKRGIPLFVEKPVTLNIEEAESIATHIDEASIVNQVGYVLRYDELTEKAQELLSDTEIGSAVGKYCYPGPPDVSWWRNRNKSGGQIIEQSTHLFDTLRYLIGDVRRVAAMGERSFFQSIDFPDTTGVVLEHSDGTISQVLSSLAVRDKVFELHVLGPDVDLSIDFIDRKLSGVVENEEIAFQSDQDPFRIEIESFLNAVESSDPTRAERSDYSNAIKTLNLTIAVDESASTNSFVQVRD